MTDIRIDSATPDDIPTIRALIGELAEFERLSHEAQATDEQLHENLFGPKPSAEVVIARVGEEVAGFALFFHNYSTFLGKRGLYLEDLFVFPARRGRGIGRALMRHLAQLAVERNCGRFEWWVLDWNESAIRFYESLGARAMSDWTVYRLTGDSLERLARDTAS